MKTEHESVQWTTLIYSCFRKPQLAGGENEKMACRRAVNLVQLLRKCSRKRASVDSGALLSQTVETPNLLFSKGVAGILRGSGPLVGISCHKPAYLFSRETSGPTLREAGKLKRVASGRSFSK